MKKYTNTAILRQDSLTTGNADEGATVRVYIAGTATLATIYSDNGVTAITQPFTTNSIGDGNPGQFSFYSAGGLFDIVLNEGLATEVRLDNQSVSTEVNVLDFGAVGDGVTDDSAAIQAAIDYAESLEASTNLSTVVYTPSGLYMLASSVNANFSGSGPSFRGDGVKKSRWKSDGITGTMMTFGTGSGTFVNRNIRDMSFDGSSETATLIDATEDRYFTIQDCEFRNFTTAGLKLSKFTIRILNNSFVGNTNIGSSENSTAIGVDCGKSGNAMNDVIFRDNYFHKLGVGIRLVVGANDLKILQNDFDTCTQTGIYSQVSSQNLSIKGNYFERTGKTLNATDTPTPLLYPTDSTPMYGSIICHEQNGAESSGYNNLRIDDNNYFANVNSNEVITLSNVFDAKITDNRFNDSYSSTNFVKLIGQGTGFITRSRRVLIEGTTEGITKFLDWDLTPSSPYEDGYLNGLIVRPLTKEGAGYRKSMLLINDPTTFKHASQTINATNYGLGYNYEFVNPRQNNQLSIDITEATQLLGRYVRIFCASKSQSANSGGLRISTIHDGAVQTDVDHRFNQTATSSEGYKNNRSIIVQIPTTLTTSWGVELFQTPNESIDVINFSIFDAAIDPDQTNVIKPFYD